MIDEKLYFSMGNVAAPKAVQNWLIEMNGHIVKPMALLLTELERPEQLAANISRTLDAYAAPLHRIVAEHDKIMKGWELENPDYEKKLQQLRSTGLTGPQGQELFSKLNPPPFPDERKALDSALATIAQLRSRCEMRLKSRVADKAAGVAARDVDPGEESDPVIRMWASRLREQADMSKLASQQREDKIAFKRHILDIRLGEQKP